MPASARSSAHTAAGASQHPRIRVDTDRRASAGLSRRAIAVAHVGKPTYIARRAIRAGVPHSERHKVFRGRVTDVGSRVKGAGGADLRTSVTQSLQPTEISNEIRPKNAISGVVSIITDAVWPRMYRLRFPDGHLSDMVNLTRARDALRVAREGT